MEPDLFRFDDPRGSERKKTNFFAWTVAILLLSGVALAAWLGSQPEDERGVLVDVREPGEYVALTVRDSGIGNTPVSEASTTRSSSVIR